MVAPSPEESTRRAEILRAILGAIGSATMIKLPAFDRSLALESDVRRVALVGLEPNAYGGTLGEFRYQFEGEEDLLHLFVMRLDGEELSVQEAQRVAGWLLAGVSPGLIWLKPGKVSQHFYVGHDLLVEQLQV